MIYHPDDTIAAIATAPGGAARGLVRVSGVNAVSAASSCFEAFGKLPLDSIRQASAISGHAMVSLERSRPQAVPCALSVWPTSSSYTREPVVEFHTIGSPPVLAELLSAVCRAGARLAEPGEFTLRAFLAGRIDLTQAEAVLGVIDAHQAAELHVALRQLAGGLARPLDALRDNLLQLLAELEAGLDFVEEEIEFISRTELHERLLEAERLLTDVAEQMVMRSAETVVHQIALVGPPNAGKSSLFNALTMCYGMPGAGANRSQPAIVSPTRGTTRDYLRATIDLDGLRCELIDTAGLDPQNAITLIDTASQTAALQQRDRAAIRAWCIEAPQFLQGGNSGGERGDLPALRDRDVIVITKSDLVEPQNESLPAGPATAPVAVTSSITGQGLAELGLLLRERLIAAEVSGAEEVVTATADRCRESVRTAASAIARALALVDDHGGEELIAVEVRAALDEIGKVVGAVYTDDLLDRIFKTFCIGK